MNNLKNDTKKDEQEYNKIFEIFKDGKDITDIGKIIGRGAYSQVREIKYKQNIMVGKLIKRAQNKNGTEGEKINVKLNGENIIKIDKIYTKKIDNKTYDLIIMERAMLRDLGQLNYIYHKHNLLKLIYFPFIEKSSEFLLKYYFKQLVNALEQLERNYFVHFDLKPENILLTNNLRIKISDFSMLRNVKDGIREIPWGTPGYITPEYYQTTTKDLSREDAEKQDYFALGGILFNLLMGEQMIKLQPQEEINRIYNSDKIIEILEKQISVIQSRKTIEEDLIKFLCGLISYKLKDRLSFEKLYRNKWINENITEIEMILLLNENDEEKLILELQKGDFLTKKINKYYENIGLEEIKKNKEKENKKLEGNKEVNRFKFTKKSNIIDI